MKKAISVAFLLVNFFFLYSQEYAYEIVSDSFTMHNNENANSCAFSVTDDFSDSLKREFLQQFTAIEIANFKIVSRNSDHLLGVSETADSVLICNSQGAYAYHSHYCQGLKKCKSAVIKVTLLKARQMGRKPCSFCY